MAAHTHGGCVLTAGECIGRGPAEHPNLYSPLRYIGLWHAAQMPLGLLALAAVAGGCYVQRQGGGIRHLIAASLAWPLLAIVWNQSTLYDGIRHTLFLIPLLVAFVFCNIPAPWWRRGARWLAAYGAALALQIGLMSPYHYVWFNEAARFYADHRNYVTDYWAFSLGESIASAERLRRPDDYIVGMPYVLVAPSFEPARMAASVEAVPPGASYLVIAVTSELPVLPPECTLLSKVQRPQWPSPLTLDLSLVARCVKPG